MNRSWFAFVCAVVTAISSSCGGGGSTVGPSSGLPRATTLARLTSAQIVILCDWTNARQGGYGRNITCADGSTQDTDASQSECIGAAPGVGSACPTLTVGDAEDCVDAIGTDLCAEPTAAGCANVNACANGVNHTTPN